MARLVFVTWLLGLVSISCSTTSKMGIENRKVEVSKNVTLLLPRPKEISPKLELQQIISFNRGENKKTLQVVFFNNHKILKVLGLAPLVGVVFEVEYDGERILTKNLPEQGLSSEKLERALADLVLVWAPASSLNQWLSEGAKIVEKPGFRKLVLQDREIVRIEYSAVDKWQGRVTLTHNIENYQIVIKSLGGKSL